MTASKKVLVFGGTGPTGLLLLRRALEHGHHVTAYVRNESKLSADITSHAQFKVVTGQLADADRIAAAVQGQDVIVSALGPQLGKVVPGALPVAARNILAAMRQHGVSRIIALATTSYLDPKDTPSVLRNTLVNVLKLTQRAVYDEVIGVVKVFEEEGQDLAWTICRVGGLASGTDEQVTTTYGGAPDARQYVNRIAIARWLVDEMESAEPRYVKEKPYICTQSVRFWQVRF